MELLTEDAALYADGGGKVTSVGKPLLGAATVAKFLVGVYRQAPAGTPIELRPMMFNAEPGALVLVGRKLEQAMTFALVEGRIHAIYVVRNPEKLKHLCGLTQ